MTLNLALIGVYLESNVQTGYHLFKLTESDRMLIYVSIVV